MLPVRRPVGTHRSTSSRTPRRGRRASSRRSLMPESRVFLQGPFKIDFKKGWLPAEERRAAGLEARTRVSRRELGDVGARRRGPRSRRRRHGRRQRRASSASSRCARRAWRSRRSRSTVERRSSWPTTWGRSLTPASTRSSAATRTSPTSACTRRASAPGVRHQRLRRDRPGAVGVGPQASCHELRPGRSRQRHRDARRGGRARDGPGLRGRRSTRWRAWAGSNAAIG